MLLLPEDYANLTLYKNEKKWNSNIVDLLPYIISIFLKKSILIIHVDRNSIREEFYDQCTPEVLSVALKSQHCWGLNLIGDTKRVQEDFIHPTLKLTYANDDVCRDVRRIMSSSGLRCNMSFRTLKLY